MYTTITTPTVVDTKPVDNSKIVSFNLQQQSNNQQPATINVNAIQQPMARIHLNSPNHQPGIAMLQLLPNVVHYSNNQRTISTQPAVHRQVYFKIDTPNFVATSPTIINNNNNNTINRQSAKQNGHLKINNDIQTYRKYDSHCDTNDINENDADDDDELTNSSSNNTSISNGNKSIIKQYPSSTNDLNKKLMNNANSNTNNNHETSNNNPNNNEHDKMIRMRNSPKHLLYEVLLSPIKRKVKMKTKS